MYIGDFPLVHEQESGRPYSESSSTELKDQIAKAAILESKGKEQRLFLSSEEVCYTYLSTERPAADDSDWKYSIVNKKMIPEGETYYQIPYLKDVWVSRKVGEQLNELIKQIKAVQPKLVIVGGKWALFFLASLYAAPDTQLVTIAGTKNTPKKKQYFGGLNKYRSSLLCFHSAYELPDTVLLPILTPSFQWIIKDKQEILNKDYAKIAQINRFLQGGHTPTTVLTPRRVNRVGLFKQEVIEYLQELLAVLDKEPTMVVFDVETRHKGIDCEGICYKSNESFTIPFTEMYEDTLAETTDIWKVTKYKEEPTIGKAGDKVFRHRHYWAIEDEVEIMYWLGKVKLHSNCLHVGQNYLYDAQWYFKQWNMKVTAHCDTMILHHVLYNYLQKDLGLLASMYAWDFTAWKDEISSKDNMVRWAYNGKDVCYNYTVAQVLLKKLATEPVKLQEFYKFQQEEVCKVVVTMMGRGVAIDSSFKTDMYRQFTAIHEGCLEKINYVFNEEVNFNSQPQVKRAFKDMLGIVPIKDRKTKSESFGAEAMLVYLDRYPEYRSLLTLFLESKSIKVFLRTFLGMQLSDDGRLRCSYNPAGTKTYRFSSRKGIDGTGGNLANIPSKGKIDLRYSLQDIPDLIDEMIDEVLQMDDPNAERLGKIVLPNCKKMFIPDPNMIFFDADYSAIDLHFVVWESDCKFLKDIIKAGKDTYSILASHYYQRDICKVQDPETGKWDWMPERQIFKAIGHGSNYLGKAPTLSAKAGLAVGRVKQVQDWYFSQCPEIPRWHNRIEHDCKTKRYTENIYGARFWCINPNERDDATYLNKMVAAPTQGAAAITINKAICAIERGEEIIQKASERIQVLLQTHDSASGQFHKDDTGAVSRIKDYMEFTIPYDDPLVIPAQIKISDKSYGECA
jgi:DNA polymerase I-like protein with 3'-5' exonuclease and polymerase domains